MEQNESMLLTRREAATTLAISPRKLWQLTACGEIDTVRIGRCVRYSPAALRAFVERQTRAGR